VPRVGYLHPGSHSDPARQRRFDAFRKGLRELGYVEGQSIAVESRWAEGKYDRYPALAADLVRSKVDVIVAGERSSDASCPTSNQDDPDRHVAR
jgi:putative ABC transport system substrate-binding protein